VYDVVILSLVEGGSCGRRVPALHCADMLTSLGARPETVVAGSDAEIDEVLARFDDPFAGTKYRLIIAPETDGQLRHIVRRLVRRMAPPPSRRPADLPEHRTIPDLPALGILPLAPGGLAARLGLPSDPADVAAAVVQGATRVLDLLRHDGGSVTLDGVLLGAATESGAPLPFRGRVEVDDAVLSDGGDPIVAMCVANADGSTTVDGLPLVTTADPADGVIDVAIAVPITHKPFLGKPRLRFEVRRARGRAVSVTPHGDVLPFLDDGVAGALTRKRSWWIESRAWSVYTLTGRTNHDGF
jgi:hypothetical protein